MLRKAYKVLRKNSPEKLKGIMTRLVYASNLRPRVLPNRSPIARKFPAQKHGGIILSADFELAWASRFVKNKGNALEYALKQARNERKNIPHLIALFEKYNFPVTWATVGHLFMENYNAIDHQAIGRIPHFETEWIKFSSGDWFDQVPKTDWQMAPEWYCPDLIKNILYSKVGHEFATHTFSHINFSDKLCPPQVADDEIKASIKAMQPYGLTPVSICFPFGSYGNVEVLKNNNIRIYRRKVPHAQLAYPFFDDRGLLVTLSTNAFDRSNKYWSSQYYQSLFIKAIDKAIKTGTIAHFVFHPSMDRWMITEVMDAVLEYSANKRAEGSLWIGTMNDIAKYILKQLSIERVNK